MRRAVLAALVVVLAGGMVFAASNRDRGIAPQTTCLIEIGSCEGENGTAAEGWDQTIPSGGWGGQATSTFGVVWESGTNDVPTLGGRMAKCTIDVDDGYTPKQISVKYLAGQANDDFCVFATGPGNAYVLIGCVDENNVGGEQWRIADLTMPGIFSSGQDVTVKVLATGNAWNGFNTWGQMAIDWIKVKGD